jgi:hypothetical protein
VSTVAALHIPAAEVDHTSYDESFGWQANLRASPAAAWRAAQLQSETNPIDTSLKKLTRTSIVMSIDRAVLAIASSRSSREKPENSQKSECCFSNAHQTIVGAPRQRTRDHRVNCCQLGDLLVAVA